MAYTRKVSEVDADATPVPNMNDRNGFESSAINVLDTVLEAFLSTCQRKRRHWSLDDILGVRSTVGFKYEHLSIPYYGEVHFSQRAQGDFVEIKLVNDGYDFSRHISTGTNRTLGRSGRRTDGLPPALACRALPRNTARFNASTTLRPSGWMC